MQKSKPSPKDGDPQRDPETGKPVPIAPVGEKLEDEVDRDAPSDEGSARIDPNSRIPRPVQPDLA